MVAGEPVRDGAAVACTAEQTQLGEGVRWDGRRSELLRVDIMARRVYRDRVRDDGALVPVRVYDLPWPVGMIAPIEGDEGWLLGAGRGFVHLAPDGTYRTIAEVSAAGTRMNDGAGGGALFRLDTDGGVEQVLDGLTIPNGVGWSADGRTMYLVDSGPRVVHAFTFDPATGGISAGRVLVTVPEEVGSPDGMTVDAAGDLWVAIYGGGQVRRYSPEGALLEAHTVPARQSTCCAFAGPGLHRLYVTTATENWTEEQRLAEPGAGLVFRLDTDATGLPAALFQGQRIADVLVIFRPEHQHVSEVVT
jgi:sugar lactone lactonase YvrE